MQLIDCSTWKVDQEYEIFPVGARDKTMLWAPSTGLHADLRQNWPYLFKQSIASYPDQFWTEVVAYIISQNMGVQVPTAYPSIRKIGGDQAVCGALIEWFYNVETERFVHASQYFQRLNPEFDNEMGTQHNLHDLAIITRTIKQTQVLKTNRAKWLSEMVVFDALIGNTDRHQENWGFIFFEDESVEISPLFDNGTSLGHERFIDKVCGWGDQRFGNYIERGLHHLRYNRQDKNKRIQLFDFVSLLSSTKNKKMNAWMKNKLDQVDIDTISERIMQLTEIEAPIPLSPERAEWMIRIIKYRQTRLAEILACN